MRVEIEQYLIKEDNEAELEVTCPSCEGDIALLSTDGEWMISAELRPELCRYPRRLL